MAGSATAGTAELGARRAGGFNARVVAHAVRRRPLAAAGVVLLAGAVGAGVWLFLPLPKMTAAVVFHIATNTPILLAPTAEGRVEFNAYKQTQAALVKRRLTIVNALKDTGTGLQTLKDAVPDAPTWLESKLKVDTRAGSEFMQVSLEGDHGEELTTILGAVSKAYLAAVDERDNKQRRDRLAKLEETQRKYKEELDQAHKRQDTIALSLGSTHGPTLVAFDAMLQDDLRAAKRDRQAAHDQKELAEIELLALAAAQKAAGPAPVPDALVDAELRRDPAFQQFEAAVVRAQSALTETESLFQKGASPPPVVQARDAVRAAVEKRDQYRAANRPRAEAQVREALARAQEARRADLQQAVDRHKQKVDLALNRADEVLKNISQFNLHRIELDDIRRRSETTEKQSGRLADEIAQIKLELGAPPRVTLSEEPFVVPGIEGNRRLKYALGGGVLAFTAGFAGLVGWEYRRRRVTHADDVTTDIGLRLLGTVPPAGPDAPGALGGAGPALAEAIDNTRTMLLHAGPDGAGMRTVLVTSAVAGEGKTTLAGHLAISLARAGYRTLLVDGDIHSPAAHRLFGVDAAPGLCELLRGQTDLDAAVRPTPLPGLAVLPAGRWDLAARQAIVGDRWRSTKAELETRFDYVVIDTAPLLLVSDTLLLARDADRVVLSVLLGVSQVAHVAETAGRLQAVGANLTGAVVNGVWHDAYRTAYGYGKGEPAAATA